MLVPDSSAGQAEPRVVLAFYPGGVGPGSLTVLERLAARERLSLGLLGATQGAYSVRQTLLDVTQGTRVSRSGYEPADPPRLVLRPAGSGGVIGGWPAALRRARSAPADIVPGLLAGAVPGGASYVGVAGAGSQIEAVAAADRRGRIAEVSLGGASDVAARVARLAARRRFVVAALPPGRSGDRALDTLIARRAGRDLLLVVRAPPRSAATQMLPAAAAGLRARPGLLESRTTRRRGLVAGIDVAPTVLDHLGLAVPGAVRGRAITVSGERDAAALRRLERRLRVVYPRRQGVLEAVLAALVATALGLSVAGGRAGRRRARRVCALAVLWIPAMTLVAAALAPARGAELILMAAGVVGLAFLTDWRVPWPRGPAVPALTGVLAFVVDLFFGSGLIVRSLLGPNPRFGSRFYGIGNELEAILPLLLLVGLAAAVGAMPCSGRLALRFGAAMLLLGVVVGAGRLGADVGGVITIGAAGATAVVCCLPGRPSRRVIALAAAVPALALLALAAVDLLTGGDSHFSALLGAGTGDSPVFGDTLRRRSELAWNALWRGWMPLATVAAVAAIVVAVRWRRSLYAPVAAFPGWCAALWGGLAGAVAGSLANDSGPVLLVYGTVLLGFATLYVRGRPEAPPGRPAPAGAPALQVGTRDPGLTGTGVSRTTSDPGDF